MATAPNNSQAITDALSAVSVLARVHAPVAPQHYSGRLVWKLRELAIAAGFAAAPVAYNHGDGRHSFRVEINGRSHIVTVEPDQDEMRREMQARRAA